MRIIYLDLDALTPSHLSCYGYHRSTSPTIDAIAAEGVRCTNVYTTDAPCLPSRTAFYAGRYGIQTGVVGHGGSAAQPKVQGQGRQFSDDFATFGLAAQLQNRGHHTAMVSPFGQRHAAHWFYAGFNEIHNTGQRGLESAEQVSPIVMQWLADHATDTDWYLHINYWDIHTPYRVPLDYGEPFANDPLPEWLDDDELIKRHNKKTGPHSSLEINMYTDVENPKYPRHPGKVTDKQSMRRFIDGYDTAIRYVDDQIAAIVNHLKDAGIYDDTAIIISADHGENLGELGIYAEHGTADQGTCNIPMIVKWPNGAAGVVDDQLHNHLDWAPTMMDLLGGTTPDIWDGSSYAPTIRTGASCGQEELIVSQCCHVCQRAVRYDDWLYIRTYHDGFHLFPDEMLFNIADDPHEQNDVAAKHPGICREASYRLSNWHAAQMQKMVTTSSDMVDPLWTVIREGGPYHAQHAGPHSLLPGYIKRLESTGRADGAAALRKRYAAFLPD